MVGPCAPTCAQTPMSPELTLPSSQSLPSSLPEIQFHLASLWKVENSLFDTNGWLRVNYAPRHRRYPPREAAQAERSRSISAGRTE
jgi:hypothetical protein